MLKLDTNFAALARQIEADLREDARALEAAQRDAVRESGVELKADLRAEAMAAGFSPKLAKTWQSKFYANKGGDPASLIYSKAPGIMRAAAEGPVIRPRSGKYLVMPTPVAVAMKLHRGRRMTARGYRMAKFADVEKARQRFGKLRVVKHPKNPSWRLLVVDNVLLVGGRVRKARKLKSKGNRSRYQRGARSVALFELRPDVRWKKRMSPQRRARVAAARTVNLLDKAFARRRDR